MCAPIVTTVFLSPGIRLILLLHKTREPHYSGIEAAVHTPCHETVMPVMLTLQQFDTWRVVDSTIYRVLKLDLPYPVAVNPELRRCIPA
jgi:hypothetical protein